MSENENGKINKTESGFSVTDNDGKTIFVSYDEIYGQTQNKTKKSIIQQLLNKLPESVRALLFFKNDEDRVKYLQNQSQVSLNALAGWFTYVLLKGNILEKCIRLGITVPEKVSSYLNKVEQEVKKTGKLTLNTVTKVVDSLVDAAIAIAVISFGTAILLNPSLLPVVLAALAFSDVASLFRRK